MAKPQLVTDPAELLPRTRRRAVVMTMGNLHRGHAELIRIARDAAGPEGEVLVTIFVNPLQFGANEDLASYPRTLSADLAVCADFGADVVFAPSAAHMYPQGAPTITVDPGPLGHQFEGVDRPDHFRGVLTVVSILLNLTQPDIAVFGEKDYQQLTLIRQLVRDLHRGVDVIAAPTWRDADGLASSSRNSYLSAEARHAALQIPAALRAGQAAGSRGAKAVEAATLEVLRKPAEVPITVSYVAVTDLDMGAAPEIGEARLILTAKVDGTRLLDNGPVWLGKQP